MRSLSTWNLIGLLLIGVGLAAGNVWVAAQRSTIPLAIEGTIAEKFTRKEKHPPKDDVHYLRFADGSLQHVDAEVAELCEPEDTLEKEAWSQQLIINGEAKSLTYSLDLRSMLIVMPLMLLILFITAVAVLVVRRRELKSERINRISAR